MQLTFKETLEEAIEATRGIGVLCNDREAVDRLRQNLYAARKNASEEGDSRFDGLSFSIAPFADNVLFIYPRKEPAPNGSPED